MATPTPVVLVWANEVGYRGNDIHLLRSSTAKVKSEGLESFLRVQFDNLDVGPVPKDMVVLFDISVPSPAAGDSFINRYGFDFSIADGVVTLETAPTSRVIHNFIITASAKVPGTDTDPLTATIRLHIHESRGEVRLQPNPLRIRKGTALRFSVLVSFNDVIGDVSFHPGLTWTPSSSLVVGPDPHSSVADKERAYQDGGFVSPAPNTTATSGTVKVDLPASLGGATKPGDGEATVNIIEAWKDLPLLPDQSDPYQAIQIPVGPGIAKKDSPQVRNVLFLPEGFQETEEPVFEQLADQLAFGMRALPAFIPFTFLGFNFFRLWVQPYDDAKRSGVTELHELFPDVAAGSNAPDGTPLFRASELTVPEKPENSALTSDTSQKTADQVTDLLSQLVYRVGLPVANEPQATLSAQITEWNRIYQAGYISFANTVPASIQTQVFLRWVQMSERSLTIETDTLFQIAAGGRPNVHSQGALRVVKPHPLRYTREDLDPLLSKIFVLDEKGNQVSLGNLWVDFSSKDVSLVCFVTRCQQNAGASSPSGKLSPTQPNKPRFQRRWVALGMEDEVNPLLEVGFDNFFSLTLAGPIPGDAFGNVHVTSDQLSTVAHELCHNMLCGDEYATSGTVAGETDLAQLEGYWNLQHSDEVGGDDEPVHVGQIRWRWPRIAAAGVMASGLKSIGGNQYTVDMKPGHVGLFANGDEVRYRPAALLTRASAGDILRFNQPAALFSVSNRVKNTLTLDLVDPKNAADFNNDSAKDNVLYKPVRTNGTDELIIHPAILSLLGSSGVLSRTDDACDSFSTTDSDSEEQQPKRPLPSGFRYPASKSTIIGLYDGGNEKRCGIYHATGRCMMRMESYIVEPAKQSKKKKKAKKPEKLAPLCHVCRYILVDLVDPRRHFTLNNHFPAITNAKSNP